MKRSGILNAPLSRALAELGHGDVLLVVDAGFPIPRSADRVDLALTHELPDLRTVLALVHRELFVEGVVTAAELHEHHPTLIAWLREEFADADFGTRPHAEVLTALAGEAKTIVRTGAFEPWGNIGLICGVDVPRFFSSPDVSVPAAYRARLEARSSQSTVGDT